MMLKINYVELKDLPRIAPLGRYDKVVLTTLLKNLLDLDSLSSKQLPSDLTDSNAIYNELASKVLGKFYDKPVGKIVLAPSDEVTESDINAQGETFAYHFIIELNDTHDRYMTLLNAYASAKAHLMDDVKSHALSKRKHNDTPQNPNTADVYEGDNYITDFTKFDTENSSELSTKMSRLREIEDAYSNVMSDWVNEFEGIFMEEKNL